MSRGGSVQNVSLASLNLGGGGDEYLAAAAQLIADGARALASEWSRKIPAAMTVTVGGMVAVISDSAPNARPAEYRLAHPLFGDREFWYGPPGQPFLSPAAISLADAAMAKYAMKIDALAIKAGFH